MVQRFDVGKDCHLVLNLLGIMGSFFWRVSSSFDSFDSFASAGVYALNNELTHELIEPGADRVAKKKIWFQ